MSNPKTDLIMHPVRMRILLAMIDQRRTAQQLAEMLDDVPQATLYRHINKLVQGDILEVVEERPIRGTVEKVYSVSRSGLANVSQVDINEISKDDWLRYFTSFLMGILADFSNYLKHQEKPDLVKDGVSFRQVPLYLSDQEFMEFAQELGKIYLKALENKPEAGRRRRIITNIVLPIPEAEAASSEQAAD